MQVLTPSGSHFLHASSQVSALMDVLVPGSMHYLEAHFVMDVLRLCCPLAHQECCTLFADGMPTFSPGISSGNGCR